MIAVIDYDLESTGKLINILNKFQVEYKITSEEYEISNSSKIILPDARDFKKTLRYLHMKNLFSYLRLLKKPLLGISCGMKLLCEYSSEENTCCLGLFPIEIKPSLTVCENILIPGLNDITVVNNSRIFSQTNKKETLFFNKLYNIENCSLTTSLLYGDNISASLEKEKFSGIQFLPEESGISGESVLKNFINN